MAKASNKCRECGNWIPVHQRKESKKGAVHRDCYREEEKESTSNGQE